MKHTIIGTAGHVDHGKTALIKALTGVDCDRLKEEKARGLTTDLGYTYLDLPDGNSVSIIDVPGHERFIKNMLAGAGVIDNALLVVAADEGVMPQTIEHLNILTLLGVRHGIIVITKIDIADRELIPLIEEEVRELTVGTPFEAAPIIHTSAVTGEGIDRLKAEIAGLVACSIRRNEEHPFRLPIDRVFKIHGAGTIVAGTVFSGSVKIGDRLELLPAGREVRVRGMQIHDRKVEKAVAGDRVAINLVGADASEIKRGDVLSIFDYLRPTSMIDGKIILLPNSPVALKNHTRIRFYLASSEVFGRVLLLDHDILNPGEEALVQLRLESPVISEYGDRFVLRQYSPLYTIGGGVVLDPYAIKHKRHDPRMIAQLKSLAGGSLENRVEVVLNNSREFALSLDELATRLSLTIHELAPAVEKLADRIITFDGGKLVALPSRVKRLKEEIISGIAAFHREKPYRLGVSKEEVRSKLRDNVDLAAYKEILASLVSEGRAKDMGQRVALAGHQVALTELQSSVKDELDQTFRQLGLMTPLPREVLDGKPPEAEEMLELLIEMGTLVKIDEKIIIHRDWIDTARDRVVEYLRSNETMSVADCRSLLGITRKYIIPLLYYFDNTGVTLRVGDNRVLRREFK